MLFLLGGLAILCGLLLLIYLFVSLNPARLASAIKWTAIGILVLAGIALLVLSEGRLAVIVAPLLPLIPLYRRWRSRLAGGQGPSVGRSTDVETPYLRMSLDHDTGHMSGTILRGGFAGMRLDELDRNELLALLRECRAQDEDGARLVEAYLDRAEPDWRDDLHAERPPPAGDGDMTVEEAYAILGLQPGAGDEAVRAAHHRLMKQFHPDHGGSDYLATKINRARDILLRR